MHSDVPNPSTLRRRAFLVQSCAAASTAVVAPQLAQAAHGSPARDDAEPFGYCLNTSTIRGQNLSAPDQIDVAAKAGYSAVELWVRDVEQYAAAGGSLDDLRKRLADSGLTCESAIGFATWCVDDAAARRAALEQLRREMDMLAKLGGKRIAAPPSGATKEPKLNLLAVADRYRAILEIGDSTGITPQVEVWGPSYNLSRLGEAVFVAVESGHPKACVLADVYHLYRGGSPFDGLRLINGSAMHAFHVNDYPAMPAREQLTDADRVYPGDGAAPNREIYRTLRDTGFRGYLSLELFNRDYWMQDALTVAKTGLEKTRATVRAALA